MYTHNIDPVIIQLGSLQIRWYGMMYVVGFIIGHIICRYLIKQGLFRITKDKMDTLTIFFLVGLFIGARLAYVFIYNWDYYSQFPGDILAIWKGGLSFHGAVVGIFFGLYFFSKRVKIPFLQMLDVAALAGTQGLLWGRIGNFINGELYGRVTTAPWGMIFPDGGGPYPRHPSQLYEGLMEGLILVLVLWFVKSRVKIHGLITATFFIGYGFFRFIVEFFREADVQLGYYLGNSTTMGQILCFLMVLFGLGVVFFARSKKIPIGGASQSSGE